MQASLGLSGYHSVQFYTKDLAKSVAWHEEKFGFKPMAKSTPEWEKRNGMRAVVLCGSGKLGWILCEPIESASSAGRYLARHPDGVSFLNFRVKDIEQTAAFLADRKAPFLYGIENHLSNKNGSWRETAIATAIDDVGFRFIEEKSFEQFAPGFEWTNKELLNQPNSLGLDFGIDHVTSNARSMHALTEFYRHCLGFEPYWGIEFHTSKYRPDMKTGSGLESIVMWDKESGIKFATNQPLAPYFNNSQIQLFIEDNCGSGVQHIAFGTNDIIDTVETLRNKEVHFLEASNRYYELLPERMKEMQISEIKEPMDQVQKNNILLDGAQGKYLLQIFMKEQNVQLGDKQFGPFFYEIIQREGDESFGEGNFKALFDSIEKQQVGDARQEMRDRADSLV
jgi:4-hydroxyphenylpyruvate dioxygenase